MPPTSEEYERAGLPWFEYYAKDRKRSSRDPTGWIPPREEGDDRLRIGLAHGALDILPVDTTNFPIAPDRDERSGLDHLALGENPLDDARLVAEELLLPRGVSTTVGGVEAGPNGGYFVSVLLRDCGSTRMCRHRKYRNPLPHSGLEGRSGL